MNKIALLAAICIIAVMAYMFSYDNGDGDKFAPGLAAPVGTRIDTAIVSRGSVEDIELYTGITRSYSEGLGFGGIGHRFGQYHVREGDYVHEGQLLATLDMEDIQQQIADREADINHMLQEYEFDLEARLLEVELSEIEFNSLVNDINPGDWQIGAINTKSMEIDWAKLLLNQFIERHEFNFIQKQIYLEGLYERKSALELRSNINGTITFLEDKQGGVWINPYETLVYIASSNDVFVEQVGIGQILPGRGVRIRGFIDGMEYDLTHIPLSREQRLFYAGRSPNPPVRFHIGPPDKAAQIPVGRHVSIMFYTLWEEDILKIPINALFSSPETGFYVYKIESGYMQPVEIETGPQTEAYAVVLYGLDEGDEVLVRP